VKTGLGVLLDKSAYNVDRTSVQVEHEAITQEGATRQAEEQAWLASLPRCTMNVRDHRTGSYSQAQGYLYTFQDGRKACVLDPLAQRRIEAGLTGVSVTHQPRAVELFTVDGGINPAFLDGELQTQGVDNRQWRSGAAYVLRELKALVWKKWYDSNWTSIPDPMRANAEYMADLQEKTIFERFAQARGEFTDKWKNDVWKKWFNSTGLTLPYSVRMNTTWLAQKRVEVVGQAAQATQVATETLLKSNIVKFAKKYAAMSPEQKSEQDPTRPGGAPAEASHLGTPCLALPERYQACCMQFVQSGGQSDETFMDAFNSGDPGVVACMQAADAAANARQKRLIMLAAGAVGVVVIGAALLKRGK
jgi:hypothetical protein